MAKKKKKSTDRREKPPVKPNATSSLKRGLPGVAAAVAAGLCIAFAFPDIGIWPLAWVAYVPLLFALQAASPGRAFRLGLLAGATANLVGFFWIVDLLHNFGHLPFWLSLGIMVGGAAYQGLSIAAALAGAVYLRNRRGHHLLWTLPVLYTAFEAFHPIIFPWYLGNCQYQLLWLVQICDLFGISAVTFLVVFGNAALFEVARHIRTNPQRAMLPASLLLGVLTVCSLYGAIRVAQVEKQEGAAEKLKVAVVEPEIGIFEQQRAEFPEDTPPLSILKWNNLRLHAISARLEEEHRPDLIVWPESTYFPAVSSWGRRHPAQWVAYDGSVRFLRNDAGSLETTDEMQLPFAVKAAHARTASRGYLVGDRCSVARIWDGQLSQEAPGCDVTLNAVWTGCTEEEQVHDSLVDSCITYAVGEKGTVVARDDTRQWVRLETNRQTRFLAVAGFGPERYVAAGEDWVVTGHLHQGPGEPVSTPGITWIKALAKGDTVQLVSAGGQVMELARRQKMVIPKAGEGAFDPKEIAARIVDAALSSDGLLYLANGEGVWVHGQSKPLVRGAFRSVACSSRGPCLALGPAGAYRLSQGQAQPLSGSPTGEGLVTLAHLGQNRDFWWLAPDATHLYSSRAPLPPTQDFPAAVNMDDSTHVRDQNAVLRTFSTPLLFGATSGVLRDFEDPNSLKNTRYNSAYLVEGDGEVKGRYDKQYLLTFGEYMPLGKQFPVLYDWVPAAGRFEAGPATAPIPFGEYKLGVLICYEDIIAAHTNRVAAQGANALFNLTNDAWFGKTKEPMQHFVLALFRSIEQRLPMVRATTTGISGLVSATGRIQQITDLHDAENFIAVVPMLESRTMYQMGGRFAVWGLLAAALVLLVLAFRKPIVRPD